ncbi:MAG TPA: O-antigen ligase family protein, partial [Candidatus Paceibacterota bacterium]
RARGVAAGALVLLLVLAGGFLLVRDTPAIRQHPVLGRIASISLAEGQTRFTIWHMAFEGFAESPKTVLVGWGQEGFNYVFNKYYQPSLYQQEQWFDRAHNAFIDWLVAGGLPAFLLYIALFGAAVWELWRRPFSRAEQIALTALLAGYAFHNLFVFDNTVSYIGFIAVLALIDSAASRPVRAFEEKPELSPELVPVGALPVAAVLLALLIGLLDVPGMNAASGLITALTPQPTFADTLNAWKQELAHPAFAAQEIREQLLTFATQVAGMSQVSDADKQTLVTLALSEMQKEAEALPQDARVRFELAVGYASFGDYKDALAQMAIARSLSPKKVTIILEEGVIRLQANDLAGAAQDFKEAYALAPQFQSLVPYGAAGDILSGNAGAAQATLARSFGTTTVDSPVLIEAYALTKNYLPLIPIYRMRAAKPGSSIDDAFRLAIAEAAAGQTQEAIAQVRAVMAAHPEATQAGEALIQQIQQGKIR